MIDWQRILLNIGKHEPLSKVGKAVGSDGATLNRLRRGEVKEPKFSVGVKLLDLHLDLEPQSHRKMRIDQ